jgi:hypothetical protein
MKVRQAFLGILMLTGTACTDEQDASYPDVPAARSAGAFDRGWIPEIVPDGATNIREAHNLDTSATWACFDAGTELPAVREKIAHLGGHRVSATVGAGPRAWWPDLMTRPDLEAYEFSEHRGTVVTVGLDTQARRVCFHRRA